MTFADKLMVKTRPGCAVFFVDLPGSVNSGQNYHPTRGGTYRRTAGIYD